MPLAGSWCAVDPMPGAWLVHGGDLLRRWTNGVFTAPEHRVLNLTGRPRYRCAPCLAAQLQKYIRLTWLAVQPCILRDA